MTWVRPELVAQVGFTEWTRAGRLRHPRFLGLRDDKAASEVVREVMSDGTIRVGRREVRISHPDKPLFADPPITKLELAHHYERVAGAMVPLVRDRPLALQAFPDGIEGKGFFMKSVPKYFPDWIRTRDRAQEGRHAHPGAGRRRGDARLPGRPERRHPAHCGCRAPTSRT